MSAFSMFHGILSCACMALFFNGVLADLLPVSTGRLRSHLEDGFSQRRSYLQPGQKVEARKYIKDFFDNLKDTSKLSTSLLEYKYTFEDNYQQTEGTCVSTSCPGVNYALVLQGTRYGTPQDKVYLVGTHYDTREDTPGVDDNGSGMSAMLETARVLSQSELKCVQLNTVVFAAFDWEELGSLYGSRKFLEQVNSLATSLNITEENFAGAVVMDTIMNWNDSEDSQDVPPGYETVLPEAYEKIQNNSFRGNFLHILQRLDDKQIGSGLSAVWSDLAGPQYGAMNIQLPDAASGKVSLWPPQIRAAFGDFLRSDHTNFWNFTTSDNKGLKAVFLTDSANLRGVNRACYHNPCDNLDQVTPEKLEFLAKTTEMLVRYHVKETTEKTAMECGGNPQENWKGDISGVPGVVSSSTFLLAALASILVVKH